MHSAPGEICGDRASNNNWQSNEMILSLRYYMQLYFIYLILYSLTNKYYALIDRVDVNNVFVLIIPDRQLEARKIVALFM